MKTQKRPDKIAYIIIAMLSLLVLLFLVWIIYGKNSASSSVSFNYSTYLSELNAFLNFLTTCFLIAGYRAIKRGDKKTHIRQMLSATTVSGLFLVSYVSYHYLHGDTKFLTQGLIRFVYFFILISHIVLSAANVPSVFITLYHAFNKNYVKHKKWARWTFPVWLYVSVTGVLIYLFLEFFNV